jgi:hypothetical protein
MRIVPASIACLAIFVSSALAGAPKHHVIVLANGDRITGEVKLLERGRLQFSTDDAGTISIEWPKLNELTAAPEQFEVETTVGRRFVGTLGPGARPGQLRVATPGDTSSIPFDSIVRITTLKSTFWGKIDGSLDAGVSYVQSSNLGQLNVSTNATYRALTYSIATGFNSTFVRQTGESDTRRASFSLNGIKFRDNRWLAQGLIGVERNDELGLDVRASGGGGLGRYLVQTNTSLMPIIAGLIVTYENLADGTSKENLEGLVNGSFSKFVYDSPKVNVDTGVTLYPSLSDWGRLRLEASATLKREMAKDLFLGLNGVESYDNKPSEGARSNDWNAYLSFGWSF